MLHLHSSENSGVATDITSRWGATVTRKKAKTKKSTAWGMPQNGGLHSGAELSLTSSQSTGWRKEGSGRCLSQDRTQRLRRSTAIAGERGTRKARDDGGPASGRADDPKREKKKRSTTELKGRGVVPSVNRAGIIRIEGNIYFLSEAARREQRERGAGVN